MTLNEIRKLPLFMTRSVSAAAESKGNESTHNYIVDCLKRFYKGDYGNICEEDTAANNSALAAGHGHILARYGQAGALESDFYVEAHFDTDEPELLDANNIMIMYPFER